MKLHVYVSFGSMKFCVGLLMLMRLLTQNLDCIYPTIQNVKTHVVQLFKTAFNSCDIIIYYDYMHLVSSVLLILSVI